MEQEHVKFVNKETLRGPHAKVVRKNAGTKNYVTGSEYGTVNELLVVKETIAEVEVESENRKFRNSWKGKGKCKMIFDNYFIIWKYLRN